MIEAYGVKGMKSKPWRKTFKTIEALNAWVEKNDAEVHGTCEEPKPSKPTASLEDLKYDGQPVFVDQQFTEDQQEASQRITQAELEWLMMEYCGTFEVSHQNWQSPPQELVDRAGPALIDLFEQLCSD